MSSRAGSAAPHAAPYDEAKARTLIETAKKELGI
jgi:hypothetical protein